MKETSKKKLMFYKANLCTTIDRKENRDTLNKMNKKDKNMKINQSK